MKTVDITGQRFGKLVALKKSEERSKAGAIWDCLCDCGAHCRASSLKMRAGLWVSCGCHRQQATRAALLKHGMANKTTTYRSWKEMHQRCNNPRSAQYKWYGARGIAVCERWGDFQKFFEDMGERPAGHTIDRVDNDADYSPGNCVWATHKEQTRKQEKNVLTMKSAAQLRADRAAGMTYRQLAAKYGVSLRAAHRCGIGETWV
jgi:hypothetical protein